MGFILELHPYDDSKDLKLKITDNLRRYIISK